MDLTALLTRLLHKYSVFINCNFKMYAVFCENKVTVHLTHNDCES